MLLIRNASSGMHRAPVRLAAGLLGVALVATSFPAVAQDNADARLRKVEAEVRALQRRVFPGGDGRFFEPEITAPTPAAPAQNAGTPGAGALTDVLARLDALERQMQNLTAQTELNQNAVATLSERIEALEAANRAAPTAELPPQGAVGSNLSSIGGGSPPASAAVPAAAAATAPSAQRLAAVQAITKPATNDAPDDEYVYGFRLYEAKFFPEAQQQLTMFVNANPRHWRATYGRNLLARAYLADNKPRDAAAWFLQNFQADKNAARAGDSLLGLAQAMIALRDTERACIALAEFADTYPALATGRLQGEYAAAQRQVRCN